MLRHIIISVPVLWPLRLLVRQEQRELWSGPAWPCILNRHDLLRNTLSQVIADQWSAWGGTHTWPSSSSLTLSCCQGPGLLQRARPGQCWHCVRCQVSGQEESWQTLPRLRPRLLPLQRCSPHLLSSSCQEGDSGPAQQGVLCGRVSLPARPVGGEGGGGVRHRVREEVRGEERECVRWRGGDQLPGGPLHRVQHGHGPPATQQDQARPQVVCGEDVQAGNQDCASHQDGASLQECHQTKLCYKLGNWQIWKTSKK